jgi:hypothetical protein
LKRARDYTAHMFRRQRTNRKEGVLPRGASHSAIPSTLPIVGILIVTPLLWFHSYSRSTIEAFVDVLRRGPAPTPPKVETGTKQLELQLAIAPTRVYCFLGRTSDAFGDCALAFRADPIPNGEISPFDTGGLVKHISPVRDWSQEQQRGFLTSYTWPNSDLEGLLLQYPGGGRDAVGRYLDVATSPLVAGPHAIWTDRVVADIWNANPDWRSWTWEARSPTQISVSASLVAWTCSPAIFPQILEHADHGSPDVQAWFQAVLPKRIDGGVGNMVAALRSRQVPL